MSRPQVGDIWKWKSRNYGHITMLIVYQRPYGSWGGLILYEEDGWGDYKKKIGSVCSFSGTNIEDWEQLA
jgi:hypothetical protein